MLPKTSVFKHAALRGKVEGEDALIAPINSESLVFSDFMLGNNSPKYRYAVIPYNHELLETEVFYVGTLSFNGEFCELDWTNLSEGKKVEVSGVRYPWDNPLAARDNSESDKDVFINNIDGFGAGKTS